MNPGKKLKKALWLLPALLSLPALFASAALTGQQIYDQKCAGCHSLGTYDTSGSPNLSGAGSKVSGKFSGGASHHGVTLSSTDITSVTAFINNPTPAPAPLAISTSTLPGATVGTSYSQTLAASGGTTPYKWSVSAGSLPAGLALGSTGTISGKPTATGTSSFTVKVTDSATTAATATKALSITVAAAGTTSPLSITTTSLANGTTGTAYSQTLSATGGVPPYTWSYSGTLPAGIGLTSAGSVTGTPTAAGTFSFTAKVADSKSTAATQALSITITAPAPTPMTASDKNLFITNCMSCHTPTGVQNATAAQIQTAINNNTGGMGTSQLRALSSTSITAIARSLVPQPQPAWNCNTCHSSSPSPSPSPTPTPTAGQQIYDQKCAGCHSLGTYDTSGSPDLSGKGSLVSGKFNGGANHHGVTLSATDITNVTTFINNPTSSTPTPTPTPTPTTGQAVYDSNCAGCHRLGTYDTTGSAPNLYGDGSKVSEKYKAGVSGHKGITLSSTQISNLVTFLNNPTSSSTSTSTSTKTDD
jgi:mono/diheme cytochrome c family protein